MARNQEANGNWRWTNADCAAALAEGWAIFEGDGEHRIERDDEADILAGDGDAWRLVAFGAAIGSRVHERALAFIQRHGPAEYGRILALYAGDVK